MKQVIFTPEMWKTLTPVATSEIAQVYQTKDGEILKLFMPQYLEVLKTVNICMEQKILDAKSETDIPELLIPTSAVYTPNHQFVGYTLLQAKGIDYNKYNNLSLEEQSDLYHYAEIYKKIETPIRQASHLVFPDLCTLDNIFIDEDKNIQFIDYDGIQVGHHKSISISSSLGDPMQYMNSKYMQHNFYTKELDKKSLIILYFLDTFHANLNKVGSIDPATGQRVTLDDFFECIQLDDCDVMNKVWKLFQNNKENEYLGDDVFHIAENYQMNVIPLGRGSKKSFKVLT